MTLDPRIAPQMAAAMAKSRENSPGGRGDVGADPIEQVRERYAQERAYWNAEAPSMANVEDHMVRGPEGDIPTRLYYPAAERPLPGALPLWPDPPELAVLEQRLVEHPALQAADAQIQAQQDAVELAKA